MKRAVVSKPSHRWHVCHVLHGFMVGTCLNFPTHTEALAHALAHVGLDRPAEHREAP